MLEPTQWRQVEGGLRKAMLFPKESSRFLVELLHGMAERIEALEAKIETMQSSSPKRKSDQRDSDSSTS